MGTDIHGIFQKRTDCGWEDVATEYDEDRHYRLFSALAGIRNGVGFAGITYGEPIKPISEPRGLPNDFIMCCNTKDDDDDDLSYHLVTNIDVFAPFRREYKIEEGSPYYMWMGDHSFSWLSDKEMLEWYENAPVVISTGIVSRAIYEQWDGISRPSEYCGDVCGPNIKIVYPYNATADDLEWTHVRCCWESVLKDDLAYFFNEVKRLKELHGEIRYVFGFDS